MFYTVTAHAYETRNEWLSLPASVLHSFARRGSACALPLAAEARSSDRAAISDGALRLRRPGLFSEHPVPQGVTCCSTHLDSAPTVTCLGDALLESVMGVAI